MERGCVYCEYRFFRSYMVCFDCGSCCYYHITNQQNPGKEKHTRYPQGSVKRDICSSGKVIAALEKIAATQKIISEQYLIFPPAIKKEIDTLSKEPEPDLKKLTTMVHSYYEWTKRSLGYPCNEWDILSKYTPIRSRHDLWLARLGILAVFIWAYAGTYVYSAIYENKNPLGLSESLLVGLGAYFVLGLGLMISALFMFLSIKVVNYVRLKIKQSSATKKNRSSPGNEGHGQSNQQNPQNNG